MSFTNQHTHIIGNLGSDPEIRSTQDGQCIASLTVAVSEKYKNRNGELVEDTTWFRVSMFGRLAEVARDYAKKGEKVYVAGKIKTRTYLKAGVETWTWDLKATQFGLLGERKDADTGAVTPTGNTHFESVPDDDIPF